MERKMTQTHHKIAVEFPIEVYRKIKKRADDEGKSFSVMAAKMADCGLFCYEEAEEHEDVVDGRP
jgi:hypothetical protein